MLRQDDGSIGSVLSPDDVSLMKAVKLQKKEGSSLLLLRYSFFLEHEGNLRTRQTDGETVLMPTMRRKRAKRSVGEGEAG